MIAVWTIVGLVLGGVLGLAFLPWVAYRIESGHWRMPRDRWDKAD